MIRIQHVLVKSEFGSEFGNDSVSFCTSEFREYFKFGRRNSVFFLISDRDPRNGEAYRLIRNSTGNWWNFADEYLREYDPSPWPIQFDMYLDEKFGTSKPVWIWVEF